MNFVRELGRHLFFLGEILQTLRREPFETKEFLYQLGKVAWNSLPTVLAAGLFTGGIMALQFHLQIRDFGAEATVGGLATSGTLREVGPVLIAFMLAAKVGAHTSAELGTMKVTDQVEALRCLGVDPMAFLVLPRYLAVFMSSVLLLSFGLVVSVLGGLMALWISADVSPQQYLSTLERFATVPALTLTVLKALVFGGLMGQICCANGTWAEGGTHGVGRAVRRTAVQSMVAIVLADFTITWVATGLFRWLGWDAV